MSTPFIEFTKNPDEDITNAPQHYHDFNGAAVRVRLYWTTPIVSRPGLLAHSFVLVRKTDEILRKYTLRLDPVPPLARAAATIYSAVQKQVYARMPPALGPLINASDPAYPQWLPRFFNPAVYVRQAIDAEVESAIDDFVDSRTAAKSVVAFNGTINAPAEGGVPLDNLRSLRSHLGPIAEENRLTVVFVPMTEADGYTARYPDWLPWVIVDPRDFSDSTALLHEIGHACRLAHQQNDDPAAAGDDFARYRNVMSYLNERDRLWGWQVDTIYDSYWCTGPRPKNWWDRRNASLPAGHPFLWDEDWAGIQRRLGASREGQICLSKAGRVIPCRPISNLVEAPPTRSKTGKIGTVSRASTVSPCKT